MHQPHLSKQPDAQLQPFLEPNVKQIAEVVKARNERQKWRTSLYLFALLGFAVLVINTTFLVWALRTKGTTDGVGTLYEASCDATKRANIGVHLLINILSSALLAASNYCMQCLSAPTRVEIEKAHRKGSWLDIGIPSLRNVLSSSFGTRKKICWWILGMSSFPLHFCYNSVVFMSTSAQTYGVYQFGPEAKSAIEAGLFDNSPDKANSTDEYRLKYIASMVYAEAFKAGRLEALSPLECINEYSTTFQSMRGNVFLVVDEGLMGPDEILSYYNLISRTNECSAETGTSWVYGQFGAESGTCFSQEAYRFLPRIQADPSIWAPYLSYPVQSCLSEPTGQKCKLDFSVHLIVIVIVFNVVKILAILGGILVLRNDPMLTLGDAIASFLREPDATADNMCLLSQQEVYVAGKEWPLRQQPRAFTGKSSTWSTSVKRGKRWAVHLALATGIITLIFLFVYSYLAIEGTKDLGSVLRISLGSVDARTIVRSGTAASGLSGIFQNVLVANSPQVIISLIYFSYNAAITSMLLAHEWSGFFTRRKPLRVSTSRQGHQRSSYFLQLPYRYALPLLTASTLLHWLASQSVFVISVQLYNLNGNHSSDGECFHWGRGGYVMPDGNFVQVICGQDFITLAYGPLGILLSLLVAIVMAIGVVVLGRKKLSPAPVVGSCSAAIAASCYPHRVEQAPWEKELQWGEIQVLDDHQEPDCVSPPHCSFSSLEVVQPTPGQLYT